MQTQHMSVRPVEAHESGARIRFLLHDPDLLSGVDARLAAHLQRTVTAPLVGLRTRDPSLFGPTAGDVFGLLLLDGLLGRRLVLGGRSSIELLGAGDLVRPWQQDSSDSSLWREASWRVLVPGRVAVLDGEVVRALAHAPAVLAALIGRVVDRNYALSERLAIAQMPVLRARVMALLWHLADRWGRVEPGRTTIPLRLSHGTLAELLSAQRPSVSVALAGLVAECHLGRGDEGFWYLLTRPDAFVTGHGLAKAGAARRRLPEPRPAPGGAVAAGLVPASTMPV